MKRKDIEQYIKEKGVVNIPDVQLEFSIGYKEARALFAKLESKQIIRFDGVLNYIYCDDTDKPIDRLQELKREIDIKPSMYRDAVKLCILKGSVSIATLQKRLQAGYAKAAEIIDWLAKIGVVSTDNEREKRCILSKEDYSSMFDNDIVQDALIHKSNEDKNDEEERIRQAREALEKRRIEILRQMEEKIEREEDGEEEDEYESFFDADDEVDNNKCSEDDALERRKQEILRQFKDQFDNEDKDSINDDTEERKSGGKAKVSKGDKKRSMSRFFKLEHLGSKRNCGEIEFEYPRDDLWRENKSLFDKTYKEELYSILTSQNDIEQDEALSVAIDKIETMIDCKNYFKAQVLEQIINEFKHANYGVFDELKHIAWKEIMNKESDKFFVIQDGVLNKYKGKSKYLHIPEGVKKIRDKLLDDYSAFSFILEVEMPESLREIGSEAFFGCDFIEKIKFNNGLIKIGDNAFCEANGLDYSIVPETVSEMGESTFRHCDLRFIKFGKELKIIREITIMGGMKKVDGEAFSGSNNIKTIRFIGTPEELEEIKRDLYFDSKCLHITWGVDFDKPEDLLEGWHQRGNEWRREWTEKRLNGFSSLDINEVNIIFQEE